MIKRLTSTAYIPIIPILIWDFIFYLKLPPAYAPEIFNSDIPMVILLGENLFRSIIFILPLFLKLNVHSRAGMQGLIIYIIGSLFYYLTWLMLIFAPDSLWSTSIFGFAAPAYTPIMWLIGISLMADSYYFKIKYKNWHYIIPSIAFSIFHVAHALLIYYRTN